MEFPPQQTEKFKSPQEEIDFLRAQVVQRERELSERGLRMETATVVGEKISKSKFRLTNTGLYLKLSLSLSNSQTHYHLVSEPSS